MAYTRGEIKRIIRQRADLENTTAQVDSELDDHINDSAAVLHDLLISCAGNVYARETGTFNTAINVSIYDQTSNPNIYKLIRVSTPFDDLSYPLARFEKEGIISKNIQTSWGPGYLPRYSADIMPTGIWRIEFEPPPDRVTSVELTYHPFPPVYTSDSDVIAIPYSDYIVIESVLRMKDKEDRDTLRIERERAAIQKRIEDWGANFDQANPQRTLDSPSRYSRAIWRRERIF
ncbi:MAG: hypothetical protein KGL39_47440 [Patescibacteria group bacterium]|nr:hypothetical protein [Patescibacteria group bacterium]